MRRRRRATTADVAVTALGVIGLLGLLLAGRMDDVDGSPFDTLALIWFLAFAAIKLVLPRLLAKQGAVRRARARLDRGGFRA